MKCLLINCVGGGPLARLGKQLVEHGLAVESVGEFSYEEWGSAKSAGQIARIISKLRTFGLYPLKALIKATRSDCSTIVCSTNPFLMPWVMTQTRRIHRKKVITLIWDLFPDALESIQISPNGLVGRAMARMNKSAFRDSDGLVFIGREMANHSLNKYPTSQPVRIFATCAV